MSFEQIQLIINEYYSSVDESKTKSVLTATEQLCPHCCERMLLIFLLTLRANRPTRASLPELDISFSLCIRLSGCLFLHYSLTPHTQTHRDRQMSTHTRSPSRRLGNDSHEKYLNWYNYVSSGVVCKQNCERCCFSWK